MTEAAAGKRGPARTTRGLTAAVVCTLLTYTGHLGAGGATPDLGLLLVLGLLLAGFLITLADRQRGPLAILALVGGSQLGMHWLLELLGTSHPHGAPAADFDPLLMTGAHALATVVTAGMLAGVESTLCTVLSALARALPRVPTALPCPAGPSVCRPRFVALPARPGGLPVGRLPRRRGPPLGD